MAIFPIDASGKAASNKIFREPITLRDGLVRATVVEAGTFYLTGLFLEDTNGKTYTYGVDYYAALPNEAARAYLQVTDKPAQILVIINPSVPKNVLVTYQTPGGGFNVKPTNFVDGFYESGMANHPFGHKAALIEVGSYPDNFWDNSALLGDVSKNIGFEHIVTAYRRVEEIIANGDPHAIHLALMFMRLTMNAHAAEKDPHNQYLMKTDFQAVMSVLPPSNLSPTNNASNVRPTDALVGSPYKAMYGIQQTGAVFQVSTNPRFNTGVVQEKTIIGNANRCDLASTLIPGIQYYWRVRYFGEEFEQSPWSQPTAFKIDAGQAGTLKTISLSGVGTYNLPNDVGGFVVSGRGAKGFTSVTPAIPPHPEVWSEGSVIVNPSIGIPKLTCSLGTGTALNTLELMTTKGGRITSNEFGVDFEMANGERVRVKFEVLVSIPTGSWNNGTYVYDPNGTWLLRVSKIRSITRSNGVILNDVGTSNLLEPASIVWRNTPIMTDPGSAGSPPVERKFLGQSANVKIGTINQNFPGTEGDIDPSAIDLSLHTAQVGKVINYTVPTGSVVSVTMVTSN